MADPVLIKRAEAERKWRAEMNRLGADVVRTRYAERLPVTDTMPFPDPGFVQRWLDKQDRRASLRADFIAAVAVIGTIAACIAAWPVIRDWLD